MYDDTDLISVWFSYGRLMPDYDQCYTYETFEQFAPVDEDIIGYKLRWHQTNFDENGPIKHDIFNYYYEKDERVMVWNETLSAFVCMYDFGVSVGDVIDNQFQVIGEGHIYAHGIYRRAIKIRRIWRENNWVDDEFLWVEGVGTNDRNNMLNIRGTYGGGCCISKFYGLYKDGECIFSAEDFDKYVSEVELDIEEPSEDLDLTVNTGVYNLQGIKVGDTVEGFPAGLYIVNGKKQIIR